MKKGIDSLGIDLQKNSLNFSRSLAEQYVLFTKKDKRSLFHQTLLPLGVHTCVLYLKQLFGEYA